MSAHSPLVVQASCVAIAGRAVMIEGPPGSGKSSLALELIDRGALLIGDDGVTLVHAGDAVLASPPPNTAGLLEIRHVGLVTLPTTSAPLALIVSFQADAPRFVERAATRDVLGVAIPTIAFAPGVAAPALRAQWALRQHGIAFPD